MTALGESLGEMALGCITENAMACHALGSLNTIIDYPGKAKLDIRVHPLSFLCGHY